MKIFALFFAGIAATAWAQTPAVNVSTNISATAGTLTCAGAPTITSGVSVLHIVCTVGTTIVQTGDSTVPSVPASSVTTSVQSGTNVITWIVTKGNPIPDQWQVTASDGTTNKTKSGSF